MRDAHPSYILPPVIAVLVAVVLVGCGSALSAESVQESWEFPPAAEMRTQDGMPDPFLKPDGTRVKSLEEWPEQRSYLKAMLTHYQYGSAPPRPKEPELERVKSEAAFDGAAVHERYAITLRRNEKAVTFHIEFIRPAERKRVPAIVKNCYVFFDAPKGSKGERTAGYDRRAAQEAVNRGYLLCKFNRNEVAADSADNRQAGVFPLYPEYDWGTIAAWAWAHAVVVDALDRLELADMSRLVVTGHSRGGKTALCAGIYDERIAVTAPNSSGTGGTGSMRWYEEGQRPQRISHHTKKFPHWWVGRFFDFVGKEERMPFDAHTAKALIAPRALVNAHARQDYWANPYGTELTYRAADNVFRWLGAETQQAIHWRDGGHAQNADDWQALFEFADWKLFDKKPDRSFTTLTYPAAKLPVEWRVPD